MNLWTVGCADPRLTAPARSPMDKPGKTLCVSPTLPTARRLPTSFTAPGYKADEFDFGKGETSCRLPAFSLFLPGSRPNNRYRRISSFCPTSWTWPKKCRLSSGKFSENPSPRTGCVWAHQNEWSIGWVGAGGRGGCFRLFADTIFNSRRETRAPLVDNIAHARAEFIEVQAHRGCKLSIDTLLLVLELLLDVRCQVLLVLKSEQLYMPFLLR